MNDVARYHYVTIRAGATILARVIDLRLSARTARAHYI